MKIALVCCSIIAICTSFKVLETKNQKLSLSAKIISREAKSMSLGVTLTNNTSDTLWYVSRDCSWQKSYLIDNDKWRVFVNMCYKDGPETISIPPYQSETKVLELLKLDGISKSKTSEFRIGFHCIPPPIEIKTIPAKFERNPPRDFTVWSNKINLSIFSTANNEVGR
jgi:hypothetical protein